jgi:hypothetical protein
MQLIISLSQKKPLLQLFLLLERLLLGLVGKHLLLGQP